MSSPTGRVTKISMAKPKVARSNGPNLKALARDATVDAIKALRDIAVSGNSEAARISAATALLDRGWGRPTPTSDDGADEMHIIEVVRFLDGEKDGRSEPMAAPAVPMELLEGMAGPEHPAQPLGVASAGGQG